MGFVTSAVIVKAYPALLTGVHEVRHLAKRLSRGVEYIPEEFLFVLELRRDRCRGERR